MRLLMSAGICRCSRDDTALTALPGDAAPRAGINRDTVTVTIMGRLTTSLAYDAVIRNTRYCKRMTRAGRLEMPHCNNLISEKVNSKGHEVMHAAYTTGFPPNPNYNPGNSGLENPGGLTSWSESWVFAAENLSDECVL